jgi:hypothetical protein
MLWNQKKGRPIGRPFEFNWKKKVGPLIKKSFLESGCPKPTLLGWSDALE